MSNATARRVETAEPNTGADTTDQVPYVTEEELREESEALSGADYEHALRSRG